MRRLLCIFLLMLLPLHGFAMQSGWAFAAHAYDVPHELDHLSGVSHHHNHDGSIHYDESSESVKHFAEHAASSLQMAGVPILGAEQVAFSVQSLAFSEPPQYIPDPIPERPQRPPQALG